MTKNISNPQAFNLIKNGAIVVDIRDKEDFNASHIPGAFNIDINEINKILNVLHDMQKNIIVICYRGVKSIVAAEQLNELGYVNVFNLVDGYESYHRYQMKSKEKSQKK